MKHLQRRFFAFVAIAICLSISAAAITMDSNFSSSGNKMAYTPTTGTLSLSATSVSFTNLKWTDTSSFTGLSYWEGEIRGDNNLGSQVSEAYSNATRATGTLPNLYPEYDEDDASIGTKNAHAIVQNVVYVAELTTVAASSYSSGIDLRFESETGLWSELHGDGLPTRAQVHATVLNTRTNTSVSW